MNAAAITGRVMGRKWKTEAVSHALASHWHWAPAFAKRFPGVRLDSAVLYVDEGDVVTSAGTAASLDCCLYLMRQWCGAEVTNRLARRLVTAPHRQGGQAQFIEQPLPPSGNDNRVLELLTWAGSSLHRRHSLDSLAHRVAMSRRTFTRQFYKVTGTTVLRWLTYQRLALASRLLETSNRPIELVATASGFSSAVVMRQRVASTFGISPAAYRKQFRS